MEEAIPKDHFRVKLKELITELHKEFLAEDQGEAKERLKKYVAYGNIIEPLY